MLVDGQPVTGLDRAGGSVRSPPGRRRFEFRYTGLSFLAPENVSFKIGFRAWSASGRMGPSQR